MELASAFLLGMGLSIDAFAVSVANGVSVCKATWGNAFKTALFFGGFQALMPALGWLAGSSISGYIMQYDHWVAFALLSYIGVTMIINGFRRKECAEPSKWNPFGTKELFVAAFATSVDAFAAGLGLGISGAGIALNIIIIGATTFVVCLGGVIFGRKLGAAFRCHAEIVGGIVLIGIGVKILIDHMM
ncbi:MAG: manganese efflux pump MntP family protein [Christensenellales bacterium]|jgi:putative Mn2+ efflux pump MntP